MRCRQLSRPEVSHTHSCRDPEWRRGKIGVPCVFADCLLAPAWHTMKVLVTSPGRIYPMIERPWYEKSITTMAALALFWPAGILLLWRHHYWSKAFNGALTALFAVTSAALYYGGAPALTALLVVSAMAGGVLLVISIIGYLAGGLTGAAAFASRKACRLAVLVLLVATAIPLLVVGPDTLFGDRERVVTEPPPREPLLTDEEGDVIIFLEDFRFTVEKEELIIQADTNLADGMVLLVRLFPRCPDRVRTREDFLAKVDDPHDLIQEASVADGLLEIRYDISMFSIPVGFFMPVVGESAPHIPDLDFQPPHVKDLYGERLQRMSLESDDVYEWYHFVDDVRLEHRGIWIEFLLVYDGYRVRYEKIDPP